jgi:hypothetical protein
MPGRFVRVSSDGGDAARWRDDGTELFFVSKQKIMAVTITATAAAVGDVSPTDECSARTLCAARRR